MNFSQLQCFVALAETGSFTEAAYTVNLTQSAVSRALATLESELGVTLIERNHKGVVALTSVGQQIMPHVRVILAQTESIAQQAKLAQSLTRGKLRLGCIPTVCPGLLAGVLTRFQQQYPEMEVVLFEGLMHEVCEWIKSSVVDIGFLLHPTPGIESSHITTDELCVLVPPGHRLHNQRVIKPGELREEPFVMPKTECAFLQMIGFQPGKIDPHIRYHASDATTIFAMVREGLGVTLLPRTMLPEKLEGVAALPLDPPQQFHIGLGVRSQEAALPGARLFIQTALDWTQEQLSRFPGTR